MDNKNSTSKALKVYVVATHLGWLIISPLLLFIAGGSWLINRFDLDSWLMIVFVLLGLGVMVCGVWTYMKQLIITYYGDKPPPKTDKRDYDY